MPWGQFSGEQDIDRTRKPIGVVMAIRVYPGRKVDFPPRAPNATMGHRGRRVAALRDLASAFLPDGPDGSSR